MKVETTGTKSAAIVDDRQCWRARVTRSGGATSRTPQPIPGVTNAVRPTSNFTTATAFCIHSLGRTSSLAAGTIGVWLGGNCGTDAGRLRRFVSSFFLLGQVLPQFTSHSLLWPLISLIHGVRNNLRSGFYSLLPVTLLEYGFLFLALEVRLGRSILRLSRVRHKWFTTDH